MTTDSKPSKAEKLKSEIQSTALNIFQKEKSEWDVSYAFVTEKVAFNMKEIIRKARKNYHGIFDKEIDPSTGRPKIWEHLTKVFVDFVVKNIDVDTKDLLFRAKRSGAERLAAAVRHIVKNKLDEIFFGDDLDIAERQLAIDGTIVWADDKDTVKPRLVNLLNFGIDPHAFSISDAYAVHERLLPTKADFLKFAKQYKFIDYDDVQETTTQNPNDPNTTANDTVKRVQLYKRVGMLPKFCLTGKKEDMDVEVPTCSWYTVNGSSIKCHAIEKRDDNSNKGYEEAWLFRVFGRWYGEGIGERLMHKQIQENTNVNVRQNRALVSQLGIFLIRQGSGITPQMISRLSANGAIPVSNLETDIKQLPMQEASQASYRDSADTWAWAQRLSGTFDSTIGESMPSSTPATNAVIQQNASASQAVLIKKQFGQFLQRWLKKQAIPKVFKNLTVGEAVRILDEKDVLALDETQVFGEVAKQLTELNGRQMAGDMSATVDPMQVQMEMQRAMAQLKAMGNTRFVELLEVPDPTEFDVQVYVTNEEMDKGVMTQNLITMLQTAPEYRKQILQEIADLAGIGPFDAPEPAPATAPAPTGPQDPMSQMTQANTFQGFGKAAAGSAAPKY